MHRDVGSIDISKLHIKRGCDMSGIPKPALEFLADNPEIERPPSWRKGRIHHWAGTERRRICVPDRTAS